MSVEARSRTDYPGSTFDTEWRRLVCPSDYSNPAPKKKYHLAIIGAGPAGLVTAIAAAGLGARVALIERNAMGGDCLNVGCVPSKALLEICHGPDAPDFKSAFIGMRAVRAAIAHHDSVERYSRAGVDVFLGHARFVDSNLVTVGDLEIRARRFVIATGARAAIPPISGLSDARPLTNETIFGLHTAPRSLAIVGAGPIGSELAQIFAAIGTDVHLFEYAERVLPGELPDASKAVQAALEADGVNLHLGSAISRVERHGGRVLIETESGQINADEILVAAGREANTNDLNLAAANVTTSDAGLIDVDRRLRTSNPRIYAAGDVCSPAQFTHHADAHARIVVQNALFFPAASTSRLIVPHCTYTQPEVAQIGPHRITLDELGRKYDTYRVEFSELDRGKTQNDTVGFAEVLTESGSDKILGATIVGRDAGEQLAGICIAMSKGIGLGAIAGTVLPYPTRSEFLRRLADDYNRTKLTPTIRRIMSQWFRWTG